jgi:hypothetical protein
VLNRPTSCPGKRTNFYSWASHDPCETPAGFCSSGHHLVQVLRHLPTPWPPASREKIPAGLCETNTLFRNLYRLPELGLGPASPGKTPASPVKTPASPEKTPASPEKAAASPGKHQPPLERTPAFHEKTPAFPGKHQLPLENTIFPWKNTSFPWKKISSTWKTPASPGKHQHHLENTRRILHILPTF